MKKALLINHHRPIDSGTILEILFNAHYSITIINFTDLKKLSLSDIRSFNLVCIFGGNASANDNSSKIKFELSFISILNKYNIPTVGICLGAQLIAKFYGSKIAYNFANKSEIGYQKIIKPSKKIFNNKNYSFMQFHNQGINYNSSMDVYAYGRSFEVDAFKIKTKNIFGFQFHPEVECHSIIRWYKSNNESISRYKDKLSKTLENHKTYSKKNYVWLKKTLLKISS